MEAAAREVFRTYNYQEIRTPIFEETALFARGVGEDTDIVGKEMYTLEDRDGTSLTLRPEATASVMRAYIEHRLDQIPGVKKYYYIGPDVPPRTSAKRPFPAVFSDRRGGDRIGIADGRRGSDRDGGRGSAARGDRRISPAHQFGRRCTIAARRTWLCCVKKLERCRAEDVRGLPAPRGHESAARARLQGSRGPADHRNAAFDPRSSVRARAARISQRCARIWMPAGLHTKSARGWSAAWITTCARRLRSRTGHLGAQNSVLGGGRYDGLAEALGSKVPAPGIGFSIGEDRLVMSVEEAHPDRIKPAVDVFLAPMGEAAELHAGDAGGGTARGGYFGGALVRIAN